MYFHTLFLAYSPLNLSFQKLKQTEFDASLENMRDEMIANERKWKEKFQKLECSQITLRKEKVKLEENLKVMKFNWFDPWYECILI